MKRDFKISSVLLLTFLLLFFGVPNIFNEREVRHFSKEIQLDKAKVLFKDFEGDSIVKPASDFYERSSLTQFLFGKHYRNTWSLPVKFPLFKGFDSLRFKKTGGGLQTTSIEVKSDFKKSYTLRTLDKDQSRPLPALLRASALRSLLRDQTSALNPYAAPVIAALSDKINIYHTNPALYIVPFIGEQPDSAHLLLAGKAVLFEEELGSKWKNKKEFGYPSDIINTDEMLDHLSKGEGKLDIALYVKSRLFDILISDWDRHGGQWKWLVFETPQGKLIKPFPIDRDMALGNFDDGLINGIVVSVSNKFKSFGPGKESIIDGANKISELDLLLLHKVDETLYDAMALEIKNQLNELAIKQSFSQYPKSVFAQIGDSHIRILKSRLDNLEAAAQQFHRNIEENTH